MKILSSTHPQVVPNLYECVCSAEHKGRYSGKQSSSGAPLTSIVFFFPTVEVNGAPKQPDYKLSSKYVPLCSAEQRYSYKFGTIFWENYPFNHTSLYLNINLIGPRMILKEYSAVVVVTKLVCASD